MATSIDSTSNNKIQCTCCGRSKEKRQFYKSYSDIHSLGVLPYCKDCIKKLSMENGEINLEKFKNILQQLDRPFLYDVFNASVKSGGDIIGKYFRMISMKQYRNLTWRDSVFQGIENSIQENFDKKLNIKDKNDLDALMEKWGYGYSENEYYLFEKKYSFLKNNYSEKTNMHIEALTTYIRYRVKEEMATARGDVKEAKAWGELASKAAQDAKINPSQLSKADLSDGLSTFSELSQAIESEVDIIPILPKFKFRPNDALDFNIWCYVNYIRDLKGLPPCKYEELYAFYDKRKKDYIDQYGDPYGIFDGDPTEKNRDKIKKFIKEDGDK